MSLRTKLADYLAGARLSQAEFARKAGIRREVLWHYVVGDRRPKVKYATAIAKASGNAVPAEYWGTFEPKLAPRRGSPPASPRSPAGGRRHHRRSHHRAEIPEAA